MGWFNRQRQEHRAEDTGTTGFEDALLSALLGGNTVTKETALQVPTVAGGVDLIGNIIASTPIKLYQEDNGKATEIKDDPRVKLLNDETGDTLNANEFWKAITRDYFLGKGGYAYINREKGAFKSIHYVDEAQIAINRNTDPIFKDFNILIQGNTYRPFDFLKILRNTKDGAEGVPITKESGKLIEVAYESLLFEKNLVKRGGNKKGFLKSEKRIDEPSLAALRKAFSTLYSNSAENMVVLNNGIDFKESSNTSVEMQLNENKQSNANEFSKIFHVSVDAISGKAGEQETASLAKLAAIPLMTTIQCALNRDFLLEKEKGVYYWAFDTKELLKGDMQSRFAAYKTALDANFMQIDEIRFLEDLEPLGMTWVKLGLNDVLYEPKTKQIYTPNTNKTSVMGEEPLPDSSESDMGKEDRANPNHDPKNGRFTTGKGLTGGAGSGNIQSSPKVIGRNGGTLRAEDMPKVKSSRGTYSLATGTKVTGIYSFAGKGTNKPIRVEEHMIKQYGGQKGKWQHTAGNAFLDIGDGVQKVHIHWFQEPSVGVVHVRVKED